MSDMASNATVFWDIFRISWFTACFWTTLSLAIYFIFKYYKNVTVVSKTNKAYHEAQKQHRHSKSKARHKRHHHKKTSSSQAFLSKSKQKPEGIVIKLKEANDSWLHSSTTSDHDMSASNHSVSGNSSNYNSNHTTSKTNTPNMTHSPISINMSRISNQAETSSTSIVSLQLGPNISPLDITPQTETNSNADCITNVNVSTDSNTSMTFNNHNTLIEINEINVNSDEKNSSNDERQRINSIESGDGGHGIVMTNEKTEYKENTEANKNAWDDRDHDRQDGQINKVDLTTTKLKLSQNKKNSSKPKMKKKECVETSQANESSKDNQIYGKDKPKISKQNKQSKKSRRHEKHEKDEQQLQKKEKKQSKKIKEKKEKKEKTHKQMAFFSIEYSLDQKKILKHSLTCLLLDLIGQLLIEITSYAHFFFDAEGTIYCPPLRAIFGIGTIVVLISRYVFKWILIEMLVFVFESSNYQCNKNRIKYLKGLVLFIWSASGIVVANFIIRSLYPGYDHVANMVDLMASMSLLLGTISFHFVIFCIFVKKSRQIGCDIKDKDDRNSNSNSKNIENRKQNRHGKILLFNVCIKFVVISGFLAFFEIILMILLLIVETGEQISIAMTLSLAGTVYGIGIVLLAPFSSSLYNLCCAVIHKCCTKCLHKV